MIRETLLVHDAQVSVVSFFKEEIKQLLFVTQAGAEVQRLYFESKTL